jgi:hypothetical protein
MSQAYAILSARVKEGKSKDRPSKTRREYIQGDIRRLMFTSEPWKRGMAPKPVS